LPVKRSHRYGAAMSRKWRKSCFSTFWLQFFSTAQRRYVRWTPLLSAFWSCYYKK